MTVVWHLVVFAAVLVVVFGLFVYETVRDIRLRDWSDIRYGIETERRWWYCQQTGECDWLGSCRPGVCRKVVDQD